MIHSVAAHAEWPITELVGEITAFPPPLIRHLIHQLIDFLDDVDGDPDLEDGDDQELIDEREPEEWEWAGDYSVVARSPGLVIDNKAKIQSVSLPVMGMTESRGYQ